MATRGIDKGMPIEQIPIKEQLDRIKVTAKKEISFYKDPPGSNVQNL